MNKATGSTRDGSQGVDGREASKISSSGKGILPTPIPPPTGPVTVPAEVMPSKSSSVITSSSAIPSQSGLPHIPALTPQSYEAVKRAQELAAKMGFRQDPEFAPLINIFPGQLPSDVSVQPKPSKAPVLRLDTLGRDIDEHGNVVNVPKVNSLSILHILCSKFAYSIFCVQIVNVINYMNVSIYYE